MGEESSTYTKILEKLSSGDADQQRHAFELSHSFSYAALSAALVWVSAHDLDNAAEFLGIVLSAAEEGAVSAPEQKLWDLLDRTPEKLREAALLVLRAECDLFDRGRAS